MSSASTQSRKKARTDASTSAASSSSAPSSAPLLTVAASIESDSKLPAPVPEPSNAASAAAASSTRADLSDLHELIIQFQSGSGEVSGPQLALPFEASTDQLNLLINKLLNNDDPMPYSFFLGDEEIISTVKDLAMSLPQFSSEGVLTIVYHPQAVFRVRAVTRCAATIPGHSEAILSVNFSADGTLLASGSGDATVRLWDALTSTPKFTLRGHKNWVLAVAFSPNQRCLASAGMDGELRLWNPESGNLIGKPLKGHAKWITSIAWEPYHLNSECTRLATASKDGTVKIWDLTRRVCALTLGGHTNAVQSLKWGGSGLIYTASHDRTIKVWDPATGKLVRTLEGHAHWVNHLALNSDWALRTSYFDHRGQAPETTEQRVEAARKKYQQSIAPAKAELLISGSDDFTLCLWDPVNNKKPLLRMTGHQQPVNHVAFSPDGLYIASASFDKSVKLWNGLNGKFITTFRGHVQAVYQVCWSADSRLICSSSKDSTMKVWDIKKPKKAAFDLPGHADEVFACDWSPDGERVASGGKDHVIKIWRQ